MRFGISAIALAAAVGLSAVGTAPANAAEEATADMKDTEGKSVGMVTLRETEHRTLLHAKLDGLPPGTHAFHVHQSGKCEPPSFTSAGDHYNPSEEKHGILSEDGMHEGDLPNIYVPASGSLEFDLFVKDLELDDKLFDKDGASFVIHQGADDYKTDPAGGAGARIACGVIQR